MGVLKRQKHLPPCLLDFSDVYFLSMESSDAPVRRLRPTSLLPFFAWAGLLIMQLISPDRAWSWLLVGLSVMLAGQLLLGAFACGTG